MSTLSPSNDPRRFRAAMLSLTAAVLLAASGVPAVKRRGVWTPIGVIRR